MSSDVAPSRHWASALRQQVRRQHCISGQLGARRGRRKILHFNVTRHPTAERTLQQLREAFPDTLGCRYVILDHDSKFSSKVSEFLKATGLKVTRTGIQAPWQNGGGGNAGSEAVVENAPSSQGHRQHTR